MLAPFVSAALGAGTVVYSGSGAVSAATRDLPSISHEVALDLPDQPLRMVQNGT